MVNQLGSRMTVLDQARARWYWVAQRMTEWLVRVGWGLAIDGRANIPKNGPFIVVANHGSYLDPMVVGAAITSRQPRPMARGTLMKAPVLGFILKTLGIIPIKQHSETAAIRAALSELHAGRPVIVYPEGLRTFDGSVGEFQRGFEVLARRTGCCVLPIGIHGVFEIWPRTRLLPMAGGKIRCVIGAPIQLETLLAAQPSVAEFMRSRVLQLIAQAEMRGAASGPCAPTP